MCYIYTIEWYTLIRMSKFTNTCDNTDESLKFTLELKEAVGMIPFT